MSHETQEIRHRRRDGGRLPAGPGRRPIETGSAGLDREPPALGLAQAAHGFEPRPHDPAHAARDPEWRLHEGAHAAHDPASLRRDPALLLPDPAPLLHEGGHAALDPAPRRRDPLPSVPGLARRRRGLEERRCDM
jgi:hypothetical protein